MTWPFCPPGGLRAAPAPLTAAGAAGAAGAVRASATTSSFAGPLLGVSLWPSRALLSPRTLRSRIAETETELIGFLRPFLFSSVMTSQTDRWGRPPEWAQNFRASQSNHHNAVSQTMCHGVLVLVNNLQMCLSKWQHPCKSYDTYFIMLVKNIEVILFPYLSRSNHFVFTHVLLWGFCYYKKIKSF